jgi:hypothetical protein
MLEKQQRSQNLKPHTSAYVSICQHTSAHAQPEAAEDVDRVFFCTEAAEGKAEPKDAVVDAGRLELVVPCGGRRKWSRGSGFFEVGKCASTRAGCGSLLLSGCWLLPTCTCFWWLLGSGLACGVDKMFFCIGGLPTIWGALRFEGDDTRGRGLGPPCATKRRHSSSQKIYKRALIVA